MQQAAERLEVSDGVIRRLIKEGVLPALQVVRAAPWEIEPDALELPEVRREIARVHAGRPCPRIAEGQLSMIPLS